MRTKGSKNRSHLVICKERHLKLLERVRKQEEMYLRDMKIMWRKARDFWTVTETTKLYSKRND